MDLEYILMQDNVIESINNNLEYLLKIIPEIKDIIGFEHRNPNHHLDVFNHTLFALSLSENDFEIRLVLLLHDIGKPHSYIEGEVRHFNNHPIVSEQVSRKILTRLNYNQKFIDEVCYLIKNHDMPITTKDIDTNYELASKRYKIQVCDSLAHNPENLKKQYLNRIKQKLINKKI